MSLPSIAPDDHSTNLDEQANPAEVVAGSTDTTSEAGSWGISSHIIEGIHLRFTNAVQTLTESSPPDFWDKAKEYEQVLQVYIPRLLRNAARYFKSTAFTDITSSMQAIVSTTATFRNNIQDALDTNHITLDMLTKELETIFMEVVHNLKNIPPPNKAPSHAERDEMVNKVLDDTELALINLLARYGIEEEVVTTYLGALRPHVRALTVAVGDINEQHPQLLSALVFSVAGMLLPEAWILKSFLSVFGFGPAGPVKGSIAAWMQRYFWGAAVKSGSWFAFLQAAGMGVIPKWTRIVMRLPEGWILGLSLSVFGLGPAGPVRGTPTPQADAAGPIAARTRSPSRAAASGGWLTWLRGMGLIPTWLWILIKIPIVIGTLLVMLIRCFRRG